MKTMDEILDYYQSIKVTDFDNFAAEVLLIYLDEDHLKQFLGSDAPLVSWQPQELSDVRILQDMKGYMKFAWGKVADHRGISASRSVTKMAAWLWLLGDEETLSFVQDESHYPYYGAPILAKICEKYGFPVPDDF